MKTLISGRYIDKHNRTYELMMEPAIDLGNGHYLIQREITVEVWKVIN
jgi:hypothetical protein